MAEAQKVVQKSEESVSRSLSNGGTLRLLTGESGEEISILNPDGEVELRVVITPEGPVLQLTGARIELKATETISMECEKLELNASKEASLKSEGGLDITSNEEMRIKSDEDIRVNGRIIHLN